MVNPGPIRVCETFLTKEVVESKIYPPEDIQKLTEAMEIFIKKCGFAVKLNQYVGNEKNTKFNQLIENSYNDLKEIVNTAVTLARETLAKTQQI